MSDSALGQLILKIDIRAEPDIVTSRQKARRISKELGFDSQDQIRLATAISELARNVFQYAGKGEIEFFFLRSEKPMLFAKVSDKGPGIANLENILSGTYVSESGLGVGLTGTKKIMDFFEIQTSSAAGTSVTVGKRLGIGVRPISELGVVKISEGLKSSGAENPFEELRIQNRELLRALEDVRLGREELAALNCELEETNRGVVALYAELDEKASSLLRANEAQKIATDDAEMANEAKSRFLSNMSHEIRTPLGVIQGFAELAMDGDLPENERREFLATIRRNALNLTKLIGEILDLSKIEAGRIEIESTRFSLPDLMSEVIATLDLKAKEKGLALTFEFEGAYPEYITTDTMRLRQILINVISNAIKFTERGAVTVRTKLRSVADASHASTVEFHVTDTGIGLTEEQKSRLFQSFMQADSSTTRKFGGTGLGLNLSKKLAQALGGDLTLFKSEFGVGSTFQITFDSGLIMPSDMARLATASARREPSPPTFSNELSGLKVLLVEDSIDNQNLFTRYLRRAGAEVDVASDGLEGVDLARSREYDVVLMDVQMPNLDGYGATSILRGEGYRVPIVALSAHALREDREQALAKGFSQYLTKPLSASLLIATLASVR